MRYKWLIVLFLLIPSATFGQASYDVINVNYKADNLNFTTGNGSKFFNLVLTGNVNSSGLNGGSLGMEVIFNICQDNVGGRTFNWPPNVINPPPINSAALACTATRFVNIGNFQWTNTGNANGTGAGTPAAGSPPQTQVNDPGNPGHFGGTPCQNFTNLSTGPVNNDCNTYFKGVNPWIEPTRYLASGSNAPTTGTISPASTALTLASAIDFKNGQGIAVFGVGALSTLSAPTITSVTRNTETTYVAASAGAITCNGAGTAATVTAIGNHGFPVGASVTISNATAPYAGTFTITSVGTPNISANQFTFNVACTPNQQISATTNNWNIVLNPGSTTYTYGVCAVDAFNGCVPSAATTQITNANTFVTQGLSTFFNLITGPAVTNATMYAIYRNGTCIGAAEMPAGTNTTWVYSDYGGTLGCPLNLPTSPFPSGATPQILVTSISSGAGTTSITLANATTFGTASASCTATPTCGTVEHDDTTAFNNAMNAACTQTLGGSGGFTGTGGGGGWVNIPIGDYNVQTWTPCLTTPSHNQVMKITVGGRILIRQPLRLFYNNYRFEGTATGTNGAGSTQNGSFIEGRATYPVFLCDQPAGQPGCQTEALNRITIAGSFGGLDGQCNGTCIHLWQSGSVLLEDVNANNASPAGTPALFCDGTSGASAINVIRGTYGQAGTQPVSYTRSIQLTNCGDVHFKDVRYTIQGYGFSGTAGLIGNIVIDGGIGEGQWDSPFYFGPNSSVFGIDIRNVANADPTGSTDNNFIKIESGTTVTQVSIVNDSGFQPSLWEAVGTGSLLSGFNIRLLGNGTTENSLVPTVFNGSGTGSAGTISGDSGHVSLYVSSQTTRGPGFQIFCQSSTNNPFQILNASKTIVSSFTCPTGSFSTSGAATFTGGTSISGGFTLNGTSYTVQGSGTTLVTGGKFGGTGAFLCTDSTGASATSPCQSSAYDNFNRANGALGSNWTTVTSENVVNVSSNTAVGTVAGGNLSHMRYTGLSFPVDQFSQETITTAPSTPAQDQVGISVRVQSGAETYYLYRCQPAVPTRNIQLVSAGGFSVLATNGGTCVAGDLLRLEIVGNNITAYYNGVVDLTATNSSITTGAPGTWFRGNTAAVDNWSGGAIHPVAQLDTEQDWTQPQHFTQPVTIGATNPVAGALAVGMYSPRYTISGGAAPTCAVTGAGTGATCTLSSFSTDNSGAMQINSGTAPGSSGTWTLTFSAGFPNAAFCTVGPGSGGTVLNARATAFDNTNGTLGVHAGVWDNNAVAINASQAITFIISYNCGGH